MYRTLLVFILLIVTAPLLGQQSAPQFGGAYVGLDARRQQLVDNWVGRFVKTTGQRVEPGPFYNDVLSQSAKTTFDAVTHALMTTELTDASAVALGDALGLVDEVDSVRGHVDGAPSDRQFRLYVRLVPDAIATLQRSTQFKRGADNSVYHQGYPINYRAQGGIPSIQISIALDKRHADIDVDYRSTVFPISLFNGHLSASNSDVRAGSNFDRHINRWSGFQNWWRGFFGVRHQGGSGEAAQSSSLALPTTPRAGRATIDKMVNDFLTAWLIEGDIVAAMGYVSERSYACMARESADPATFDRGLAPFQLLVDMKAAHDAIGKQASLTDLVVGTRLVLPGLRVVTQANHPQFVIYSVPDDVAASIDCESQLTLGDPRSAGRVYGNYFGATFYIKGSEDTPVALLWALDQGYWKIASWKVGTDRNDSAAAAPVAAPKIARIPADQSLVTAVRGFLDSWLIRHDTDAAFAHLSRRAYECYNLERGDGTAAAASLDDAGQKLRAALATTGKMLGTSRALEDLISAPEPVHYALRVMNHRDSRTFMVTSVPNALADALECAARADGSTIPDPLPLEYGNGFGTTVRFKTRGGDAPVLRLLWRREDGAWRITSYGVEMP